MNPFDRFFARLAGFEYRHPFLVLGIALATCVPALLGTLRLGLRTDWTELLPENQRSIQDLRRIQERFGGSGTLSIAIEGDDLKAMERLADDLAAAIAKLPPDLVKAVDKDVRAEKEFFSRNRHLYVDLKDLVDVRDKLKEKVGAEKSKAVFDLGLDGDEEEAGPPADDLGLDDLKKRYEEKAAAIDRYPDGYFVGDEGKLLAVFVRTAASSSNVAATNRLEQEIDRIVKDLDPGRYHPSLRVAYAGDVITARAEHDAIRDELLVISAFCFTLILGSIYFFYWEIRAILVLGAATLVGLIWTFGLTYLHIGYLSTATSFLSSIVAGNGINSGIILIARYLEERRRRGAPVEQALSEALSKTWSATLTASLAATLSYGALMLTSFRGFSQFGFIGGIGILLCWVANYTVLPALLAVSQPLIDRRRSPEARARIAEHFEKHERWNYGRPFVRLSEAAPGTVVAAGIALALTGGVLGYRWIQGDPFEYDFRNLRNKRSSQQGAGQLTYRVNAIVKGRGADGMVVLADRPEQVPLLTQAFARLCERDGTGQAPAVGTARSILDLVPVDQEAKLELLAEIRDLASQVLPRLSPEKRAEVEPWIPPSDLGPLAVNDLPATLKRPFAEKDGRLGLVLLVQNPEGVSMWDGRVLLRFAEAVRSVTLADGEVIHSSGQPVIFADMLESIRSDGPRLTMASFLLVLALVVVSFRRPAYVLLVVGALLIGMGWMIGLTALSGMKLNFLNFIALPITIGIGADYSVNMVRRYAHDGWGATRAVLLETGGAVILCSLTTIWGYLSLLYSDNQALRSFGKLAVLGEITCLAAAVVVLPAIVEEIRRRSAPRP